LTENTNKSSAKSKNNVATSNSSNDNNNEEVMTLSISSAHGIPDPEIGTTTHKKGTQIVCSVKSPVREGAKIWKCEGWVGTGSIPPSPSNKPSEGIHFKTEYPDDPEIKWGLGNYVTFPITEKVNSIDWQWYEYKRWEAFKENTVWQNQVASVAILATIFSIAIVDYYIFKHAFFVAIFMGALGGLIHELVQSYGKFLLPRTDEKGTFCLGVYIGLVSGGVAGLATYEGLLNSSNVGVTPLLAVTALLAGLATKGLVDAPNPPKKESKTTNSQKLA
jgi:hypothetical protein